jgi:hypothetical protein
MGIELTSFELLTMGANHPVRQRYEQEQAVRRETWQTDFCVHERLGAVCLGHVIERAEPEEAQVDTAA